MKRACLFAVTLTIVLAGCSSSSPTTSSGGPKFAGTGPYAVGVTTLDLGSAGKLGERLATVFYPADASKAAAHPRFSYKLSAPLPQALTAIVPAKFNSTVTVNAHVDAPGSGAGPFPIVLFSHGFGASRLYYSHILTGIASWGLVVVAADYLERGLLAQATNSKIPDSPALDLHTMFSSLTATESASARRSSPCTASPIPTRSRRWATPPAARRRSTPSTTTGWPWPWDGPPSGRPAPRRTNR